MISMSFLILCVLAIVVLIILGTFISQFNNMKRRHNQINNAYSSLDALFIKRSDMIPNLILVVKQYTSYEGDILEKITQLRQPQKGSKDYMAGGETDQLLKQLMVQVENYPELKANQQFNNLQYSINECEEQISAGRRYLSTSITQYNNSVTTFPGNMIAGFCGMHAHEWERATDTQRRNVNVDELFDK